MIQGIIVLRYAVEHRFYFLFRRHGNKTKKGGAVSRFLFLNPPFICATYPLASDGQPSSASIFGFAGPGAVPAGCHQPSVVSSYLAFSPLPPKRRLFSVPAARDLSRLGFPQQGALPCPDFPHPGTEAPERGGSPHLICGAKIIKKIDYAWLAATVASRSRASARMTIGFRTV